MQRGKNIRSTSFLIIQCALALYQQAAIARTGAGFQLLKIGGGVESLSDSVRQPISVDPLKLAQALKSAETSETPKAPLAATSQPSSSPETSTTATGKTTDTALSRKGRSVEILFGGSLCPVCLVAFQKRLAATDGVLEAKVDAITETHHTGHPPKRAHADIQFDPDKITQASLVEMIKNNDFQFLKVRDITQ